MRDFQPRRGFAEKPAGLARICFQRFALASQFHSFCETVSRLVRFRICVTMSELRRFTDVQFHSRDFVDAGGGAERQGADFRNRQEERETALSCGRRFCSPQGSWQAATL
jgi:hypothetical protein